ncbi:uncharacterized protein V6R79_022559 [Siganus canaliculatus]
MEGQGNLSDLLFSHRQSPLTSAKIIFRTTDSRPEITFSIHKSFLSVTSSLFAGHVLSEGTNITKLDGESVTLYMNRSMVPLNNFGLWTFGHHNPTVAITIVTNGKVTQVNGTRFENRLQTDAETGSITISNLTVNDSGVFLAQILTPSGILLQNFSLTVKEPVLMPIISEAEGKVTPSSETRHNQDKCLISCSVKNGPCLSLTWYRGEKEVNHTTDTDTSNLTLPLEITSQDQMNFSCVAANPLIRKAVTINSTQWCAPKGSVVIIQLLSVTVKHRMKIQYCGKDHFCVAFTQGHEPQETQSTPDQLSQMAGTARKPQTKDEINDDMTGRNEEEGGDSKTKSTEGGSTEEQLRYAKHVIRHQSASSGRRDDEDLLPHTKSSQDTVEEMKSYLRTFNAGNISQERCMNLFICKFELSEERFQDDCSALSTLLQLSGEVIDDLDLTKCYTPLHGTEKLIQLMKKCKRGALKSQHLTDCLHILVSILHSADSCLRELGLVCVYSANHPLSYDLLCVLGDSKLETLSMTGCHLKSKCGQVFASVLCSNSNLRVLDLSRNDLQDLGVQLLSVGLGSSKCRLEILRLSCCGVTEEGCVFLASALKSNPSHLKELDLSYNHPGKSGVELLSERLQDPECRMEKLNVEQNEEHWVNPQLLHNYACDVTLDANTVNEELLLSEHNRKVDCTEEKQSHPDHPERFDDVQQVMSVEGLTGRCYWEVEWTGHSSIGVAYKSLKRKGHEDTEIEYSSKAWTFNMNTWNGYSFYHMRKETFVPIPIVYVTAFQYRRRRLGLFLDWPAGLLSFYSVCGDTKTLLHTFHTTFTEPVHPVFAVFSGSLTLSSAAELKKDSTVSSFKPEVATETMCVSYRFTFPSSGLFQCSLTGLVFKVTNKGEIHYKTQIWDPVVLEAAGKVPGGPLFSIETSQNLICQLHLPHCEPEPALVSESLSVVHITDDGMSIIKPREITQTHVVVDTVHLSAFGLVWDIVERFVNLVTKPVNGQVLLFLRPSYREGNLTLRVILLPSNVPLLEVKAHHEDCENIPAPSYCLLHKEQYYSLLTDPEGFRIQPRRTRFFENYGPNFHSSFEVTLATSTEEVTLLVQDPDKMQQVWEYSLPLPASPSPGSKDESVTRKKTSAEETLQRIRAQFVERVSDPVLDKLLDELQSRGVLPDPECEAYRAKSKTDKARNVIDTSNCGRPDLEQTASVDPFTLSTLMTGSGPSTNSSGNLQSEEKKTWQSMISGRGLFLQDSTVPINMTDALMIIILGFTVIISCEGGEVKLLNGIKGGSITLPEPVMEFGFLSVNGIVIIMVREKKSDIFHEMHKNKVLWNNNTGLFTITGLERNDSGIYDVDPNKGKDFITSYNLTVYDPVSSPAVTAVNVSADSCMLLCSVDRAEHTTLLWYKGQEVVNESRAALSLNLTLHLQDFNSYYRCVAVNPAENKTSPETVCRAKQQKTDTTTRTYVAEFVFRVVLAVTVISLSFIIMWQCYVRRRRQGNS